APIRRKSSTAFRQRRITRHRHTIQYKQWVVTRSDGRVSPYAYCCCTTWLSGVVDNHYSRGFSLYQLIRTSHNPFIEICFANRDQRTCEVFFPGSTVANYNNFV